VTSRPPRTHAQRLASRVRWLERWRRLTALLIAGVAAPLPVAWLLSAANIGTRPGVYVLLVPLIAAVTWWFVEAGLGLLTAVWETDLERELGCELPRAELLPPRTPTR
jgi:hypothetical protein